MILERAVDVRHEIGSSPERRAIVRVAVVTFLIGLGVIVVAVIDSRRIGFAGGHDPRSELQSYAFEAFPAWAAEHPWVQCPESIDDLSPYTPAQLVDQWGMKLRMSCTLYAPFIVRSAGPDTLFDTADDLSSHDPQ